MNRNEVKHEMSIQQFIFFLIEEKGYTVKMNGSIICLWNEKTKRYFEILPSWKEFGGWFISEITSFEFDAKRISEPILFVMIDLTVF